MQNKNKWEDKVNKAKASRNQVSGNNRSVIVMGSHIEGDVINDASDNFSQPSEASVDLDQLSKDLSRLLDSMKTNATDSTHYEALTHVAKAKEYADKKDANQALESLRSVGSWALDIATKIGVPLAVEVIKKMSGIS